MATIICPHCGTANRAGANFCNGCGTNLQTEETGQSPAPLPPQETDETGPPLGKPPTNEAQSESATPDQPWLQPGFTGEDDVPFEPEELEPLAEDVDADIADLTDFPAVPGRLVSGVQGLLEPIRVATMPGEADAPVPEPGPALTPAGLSVDQLRRVRTLMAEEPLLASVPLTPTRQPPSLWIPFIFLLIGFAVAMPVLFDMLRPVGTARQWPGVAEAYATVEDLSPETPILIFWAYDPAMAGEMDLVAGPVLRHLLDQGARATVVSLLPNGPATARRLFAAVREERSIMGQFVSQPPLDAQFFPGGATILPQFGSRSAALTVVVAAQAEDAIAWLELVAPLNSSPVIAVTSAAADPTLRPYLDSGQLAGLVSGFDGGYSYARLQGEPPSRQSEQVTRRQLVSQNMGLLALIGIIVLGNVVGLLTGRRRRG